MNKGIIFNIQRYSIHDGPGIRTTVFLKGCPLNCWWCQNPEGQKSKPELIFWEDRCKGCGLCVLHCSSGAIQLIDGKPSTNKEKCILCGECCRLCPVQARELIGKEMTVQEIVREVEKDAIFYEESGGGVTFSGGEPLQQFDFLLKLLVSCRRKGIHTAVDTCGYVSRERLDKIIDKTDLFLFDLKLMDDEKHRHFTGVSNKIILENLKRLSSIHQNIYIRFPVIPEINDDIQNVKKMGEFLSTLRITQVNLLPYHYLGLDKYKRLGRSYPLTMTKSPGEDRLSAISLILQEYNLKVKVGG